MPEPLYDYVTIPSVGHSNFDLSFAKYLTTDFFRLVPVMCKECVPGDTWTIGNRVVLRFQPMFAPVLADISVRTHYFFVPYRLLWTRAFDAPPGTDASVSVVSDAQIGYNSYFVNSNVDTGGVHHTGSVQELEGSWEDFFRGQISLSGGNIIDVEYLQPRFVATTVDTLSKGTLWDYFGFPTAGDNGDFSVSAYASYVNSGHGFVSQDPDDDNWPVIYPWAAYNLIFNEFYRDENYRSFSRLNNNGLLSVAYAKDYFTSALPYQQKGEPIALPVSTQLGDWSIKLGSVEGYDANSGDALGSGVTAGSVYDTVAGESWYRALFDPYAGKDMTGGSRLGVKGSKDDGSKYTALDLDLSSSAFDVADLRFAFQVQKFLERSARGGSRYVEFLRAHYATFPRDERLQRPEYIGGSKQPVIISEVLQTGASEAGSPQGTMAGHAISVDSGFVGKYHVTEPGLIMGLMSIVPKAHYQQGIHRSWLRRTRFDYYFPEFQNLSEQGVEAAELYFSGVNDSSHDKKIIGYQGRYNELRMSTDEVCGDFRDILDYWHLGRKFSAAPSINRSFIYGSSEDTKRIFAVQDEDPILVSFGNLLRVSRPMVKYPEPGLVDHH